MKTFNVIFAIGAAAIGISGVMAKAVPQECKSRHPRPNQESKQLGLIFSLAIELPASILKAALAKRDVERLLPCWMAPDDSIKCPKSKREADAKLIRPCWGAPDNSIRCPVVKREPDGARCFGFVDGKECCPVSSPLSSSELRHYLHKPQSRAAISAWGVAYPWFRLPPICFY